MKNKKTLLSFLPIVIIIFASFSLKQTEPWKPDQLMPPADLAAILNNPTAMKPLIISIGPDALLKGSIDIGPANDKANLDKLKQFLTKEKKDRSIVIYCGCCPFEHCPNIRPAFILLNEMKFTNHKLLALQHNIKIDWINKGYPTVK
ncbi:MAG: rhodanese-like domain-containing protein [Ferruginibacter sp.]